jgi:hypothetical protein
MSCARNDPVPDVDQSSVDQGAADWSGEEGPADRGPADQRPRDLGVTDSVDPTGGAYRWSKSFGAPSVNGQPSATFDDVGYDVTSDASGNVTLVGRFFRTISDFGGPPLTSWTATSPDIFIASYGPTGTYRWSQRYGGSGDDRAYDVAADASGNVYMVGMMQATVDFGKGQLTSAGKSDIFVASYDASGAPRWAKTFGSPEDDAAYGVAVDASGNVTVTGAFRGTVDFGGQPLTAAGFDGNIDIFVASFDSSGAHRWSKSFGGTTSDASNNIAVDGSGNVTITGYYQSADVDFGGGKLPFASSHDIFVASFGPTGAFRWARGFGFPQTDEGKDVAVDKSGNVTVTGRFMGSVNFGGGLIASHGKSDVFVASYGPTGTFRWAKNFGGPEEDFGEAITADAGGIINVTGYFNKTAEFSGDPPPSPGKKLTSAGSTDIFIGSYGPMGAYRWVKRFGASEHENSLGVTVDPSGYVTFTGYFRKAVDFGGGTRTSRAQNDIFLVQLGR